MVAVHSSTCHAMQGHHPARSYSTQAAAAGVRLVVAVHGSTCHVTRGYQLWVGPAEALSVWLLQPLSILFIPWWPCIALLHALRIGFS
jgi:hypothetical protein